MEPREDVPLGPLTTLGVGGNARYFVEATSAPELAEALGWAARYGVEARLLGGGSNVVVSDAGYDGLVVHVSLRGVTQHHEAGSVEVTAAAGEPWDPFVARVVAEGWQGLECLSGIPGRVGATPIQNVGAYGQEVSQTITRVHAFDREHAELVTLPAEQCRFGYRSSRFKQEEPGRHVVVSVSYRLTPEAPPRIAYPELERHLSGRGISNPTLSDVRQSVLDVRRTKSMVYDPADENHRSCGSFFVNPVVDEARAEQVAHATGDPKMPRWPQPGGQVKLSAAWLIERAGFQRGERNGAVGLSSRHTLALVCHAGARASDVVAFARRVRNGVEQRFGVRLVPEPVFWGFLSLDDGLPDERLA